MIIFGLAPPSENEYPSSLASTLGCIALHTEEQPHPRSEEICIENYAV